MSPPGAIATSFRKHRIDAPDCSPTMPATAGRVSMPKGNRVDTSASLRTTGIWANTIGYDPYAPAEEAGGPASGKAATQNMYEKSKDLMAAARLTGGVEVDSSRGLWKGSGRLKGYRPPGSGVADNVALVPPVLAAAPVGTAGAGEESESESELSSDSESERKRSKKRKHKHKDHKHKRAKKHKHKRRSSSGSSSGEEESDSGRKHRRSKHKRRRSPSSSRSTKS